MIASGALWVCLVASPSVAIDAQAGGQFGGSIGSDDQQAALEPSSAFTVGLGAYVRDDALAVLWYGIQPTTLTLDEQIIGRSELDATVHHLLIGGLVEFDWNRIAIPFIEAGAGAVLLSVDAEGAQTAARFSMAFGGGVDLELLDALRLRTQVDLRLAFLGGGSLFCGVDAAGGGCLVTVSEVAAQGSVSAGLVFLF
jgi:hypothetical protein